MPSKLLFTIVLFIFLGLGNACEKTQSPGPTDPMLVGTWVSPSYQGDTVILKRATVFRKDDYGICFKEDGSLVERKNEGWCGTPPITYANFDGTWTMHNDTLIHIRVAYWGGTTSYDLSMVGIDESKLRVIYRYPGT
jgi:hypothetical protein